MCNRNIYNYVLFKAFGKFSQFSRARLYSFFLVRNANNIYKWKIGKTQWKALRQGLKIFRDRAMRLISFVPRKKNKFLPFFCFNLFIYPHFFQFLTKTEVFANRLRNANVHNYFCDKIHRGIHNWKPYFLIKYYIENIHFKKDIFYNLHFDLDSITISRKFSLILFRFFFEFIILSLSNMKLILFSFENTISKTSRSHKSKIINEENR